MENKIYKQLVAEAKRYGPSEFKRYVSDAGWESWMEDYTAVEDDEEPSEREMDNIKKVQREIWNVAHITHAE